MAEILFFVNFSSQVFHHFVIVHERQGPQEQVDVGAGGLAERIIVPEPVPKLVGHLIVVTAALKYVVCKLVA
jgi:hypothetical protein